MGNNPFISVVTVSYNAVQTIEATILSVINQAYSNLEYIIIDGGSNDGSVDIIKKYSDKISFWISEKDKGIYDAMNKGILYANGDYMLFMNAGDTFCDENAVSRCVSFFESKHQVDVYYGNTLCKYHDFLAEVEPLSVDTIKEMLPFCHQSAFIRTEYHKKHLFDLDYKIFADQLFFLNLYNSKGVFKYVDTLVSIYDAENGISSKVSKNKIKELLMVQGVYNSQNYFKELLKAYVLNLKIILKRFFMSRSIYVGYMLYNTLLRKNVVSIRKIV